MRLHSPIQAILWKCWKRTWLQLVLVITGVLAIMVPFLAMNVIMLDMEVRNEVSRAFVFAGLFFLWAACPGVTYNPRSGMHGMGFIFGLDFVRPVSTNLLVFLPLAYLCVLVAIAYLVPTIALSLWFGLAPPNLAVLFIVIEAVLFVSAIQWWSTTIWIAWASWLLLFFLAWQGWIIPGPLLLDESGAVITPGLLAFVRPFVIVTGALFLLHMLVNRIRCGDLPDRINQQGDAISLAGIRASLLLPMLQQPCPTSSPLRATWWREQQLHGIVNHAVFGAFMALCALLTVYLLTLIGEIDRVVLAEQVVGMSIAWYIVILISTPLNMFDISFRNQVAMVSSYNRTRPISTLSLAMFKVAVTISNLLIAGLVMLLTIHVAGPLFITDFYAMVTAYWSDLFANWELSTLQTCARLITGLAFFSSLVCIYAALATWLFLNSRKLVWFLGGIPVYSLVIFLLLVALREPLELEFTSRQVIGVHLWVILSVLVAATVYFLHTTIRDRVLRYNQGATFLLGCGLIWLVYLGYSPVKNPVAPLQEMAFIFSENLLGLLPLLAGSFLLWTMHRVRHT